jgi:pyruvate dehydrogenase E1 component alpha subunit
VNLSGETLLSLYFQMLRIRKVELRIESLYHLDEMKTPIHLCIGQEAVAVGVCSVLRKDDLISSNHRGHGHYLAKGGNLQAMIAELCCRETGCSKGRGGSMHLIDTSVGHIGSSSIVGGCIPIGVGLGLAIKMQKQDRVSVTFFGDGAADRGVLYESVNFAALKRLPVIFVYENNQYSVCSHVSSRQAGEIPFHVMSPELIQSFMVDGNSVLAVYEASREAVERARAGEGPSFIECKTYRVRGHAGSGPDTALGYRTAEEIATWEAQCPVTRFRDKLLADRAITEEGIRDMEQEIEAEIDEAFRLARESPLPRGEDLALYLFRE